MSVVGEADILNFQFEKVRVAKESDPTFDAPVTELLTYRDRPIEVPDDPLEPVEVEQVPELAQVYKMTDYAQLEAVEVQINVRYVPENEKLCHKRPQYFYAPDDETPKEHVRRFTKARAICDLCDIQVECLAEAIERGETGVWGREELTEGVVTTGQSEDGKPIPEFRKILKRS